MDGVSAAASILTIATTGIQVSIKLATLSSQISNASDHVSAIGNDISLTSGVLQELGELVKQDVRNVNNHVFCPRALEMVRTSAVVCERVFVEIKKEIGKASKQMNCCERLPGGKVELSKTEMIKWPFLQPHVNSLREDLKEAKGTLMLMLQVWLLALSKRAAEHIAEQRDLIRAIVALEVQQNPRASKNSSEADPGRGRTLEPQDIDRTNEPMSADIDLAHEEESPLEDSRLNYHGPADNSERTREISPASHGSSTSRNQASRSAETEIRATASTNGTILDSSTNRGIASSELCIFQLKVVVRDHRAVLRGDICTVELVWQVRNMKIRQSVIQGHLAGLKNQDQSSIIKMLDTLDDHEANILERELAATESRREGILLSLVRSYKDIEHKGIIFRNLPELQFVIQRGTIEDPQYEKKTRNSSNRSPFGLRGWHPFRSRRRTKENVQEMDNKDEDHFPVAHHHERHTLSWSELQGRRLNFEEKRLQRPIFIKVHQKYMSLETLNAYELPWEYDKDDHNYFIIRQWISESDQEILFEHTKGLREKRRADKMHEHSFAVPEKALPDDPSTRAGERSAYLRSREAAPLPQHRLQEDDWDGDNKHQEAASTVIDDHDVAVVNQLLKAYTTIFDNNGD